ncbi:TIGR04222 domain-containing membrane protein [Streptomyces sp. NPDC057253]|uniref:TIGR04222 domain-containing membrane protein n=1 Tax=Streptomyces sp. NPDC057253 TaxID=3346069 RepID=UPI00363F4BC9
MITWFVWAGCVLGYAALVAGAVALDDRVHERAVADAVARYEAAKPDPADAVPDEDLRLGIAGVAALVQGDGKAGSAFWTVLVGMVARGVLVPGTTSDGEPTLRRSAGYRKRAAPDASDLEQQIWSLASYRNPASAAPQSVTHPIAQRLYQEGYLRGRGVYIDFRAPRAVWCWTVAVLTLPLAALVVYLFLHWRYGIVAMWTAMAMVVVAWVLTMPREKPEALLLPVLTERGDQVVRQARARHAHLDPANRTEPYAPDEAAAAHAVFGLEAYNHFAAHTPGFSAAVDQGTGERARNVAAEELQRTRGNFTG